MKNIYNPLNQEMSSP